MRQGDTPVLSVLLPAFNAGAFVEDAIRSILNQSFSAFELLVADDGSHDNTKEIINHYATLDSRIKIFHNEKNTGKTATVLKLYKEARGSLLTVHDADDISLPSRFEKQVRQFENDPDLTLCGTGFITIDEKGFVIEKTKMPLSYKDIYRDILFASQFHGPTMMMKTSVLREMGDVYRSYFNDNYEDTDLAARIIDRNKGYNLDEYLYVYRILHNSLCRKKVDVRNRTLYKVVSYLTKQRRARGTDDLMDGRLEAVEKHFYEITSEYRKDPSLIHREAAAYFLYWQLYARSIQEAFLGIKIRPFNHINIRTLLYILRKSLLTPMTNGKKHYTEIV